MAVPGIEEYLGSQTLLRLQTAFAQVPGVRVYICDRTGRPLAGEQDATVTERAGKRGGRLEAPVKIDGRRINGMVVMERPASMPQEDWQERFLAMAAEVVADNCRQKRQLDARAQQLGTLYRLTAEFTSRRNLPELLNLVARAVVEVLKAKACAIRILSEDHNELVIRAVVNLSAEYLNKGPILVSASKIDQEVLTTGRPVYIADERSDPRVLYPAEARREGIVSALCVPMTYKGHHEGVLRVYTAEVYEFDKFEISLILAISEQAAAAIVNARLYEQALSSERMRRALQLAGEVQQRMIPAAPPKLPGFDIGAVYVPSYELSGDFYDFINLPPENLGIAVCDVAGKGVRASLLMASVRASLRAHAANIYDMSEVLARVNRDMCGDVLTSDFATMFYAVLDYRRRLLTYSSAGHTPALLIQNGAALTLCDGGGLLGIEPSMSWRHECVPLHPGDAVIIYTDGLSEAMNFEDEAFGSERIAKLATAAIARGDTAVGVAKYLLWEMRRFAGLQTRFDDLTLVVIKAI